MRFPIPPSRHRKIVPAALSRSCSRRYLLSACLELESVSHRERCPHFAMRILRSPKFIRELRKSGAPLRIIISPRCSKPTLGESSQSSHATLHSSMNGSDGMIDTPDGHISLFCKRSDRKRDRPLIHELDNSIDFHRPSFDH